MYKQKHIEHPLPGPGLSCGMFSCQIVSSFASTAHFRLIQMDLRPSCLILAFHSTIKMRLASCLRLFPPLHSIAQNTSDQTHHNSIVIIQVPHLIQVYLPSYHPRYADTIHSQWSHLTHWFPWLPFCRAIEKKYPRWDSNPQPTG